MSTSPTIAPKGNGTPLTLSTHSTLSNTAVPTVQDAQDGIEPPLNTLVYRSQDGSLRLKGSEEVPVGLEASAVPPTPVRMSHRDDFTELYPMDHARGWLALLATFLCNFIVFGYNYSWGLFQDQYLQIYQGQVTTFSLSFVGSLGMALVFFFGPVVGMLVKRIGVRIPLLTGGVLIFLGLFLASYATQVWQLYLTHGVLFGIGGSLTFYSSIHLPSQWFAKKRAFATGIALAGSGIGGLVMDEIVSVMIEQIGYRWALRVVSFITLALSCIAGIIAKERIIVHPPPFPKTWGARLMALVDLSLLRNGRFTVLTLMGLITTFGYIAPFYFLPSYSTFIGLSLKTGATLTSIMSAVNAIGRIVVGFAADTGGRVNTLVICTFVAGLSCLIIWPFAHNLGVLIVFVLFYGFTGGGFVSLFPVVCAIIVPVEDLANAMGLLFFSQAFGNLFGPAILGALLDATAPDTSYIPGMMFCGAVSILGALIALGLRLNMDRHLFKRM